MSVLEVHDVSIRYMMGDFKDIGLKEYVMRKLTNNYHIADVHVCCIHSIDTYLPIVRNLFLVNPVYLFIRYFRKIVIEATIPSPWFRLPMLADVLAAAVIGCVMDKKNNTKFLYYV